MQQYRAGEEDAPIPSRSDRFYKLGDDWYFQVRGGDCFGPYPCRDEAQRAVRQFFRSAASSGHQGGGAVIRPFGNQRARQWRRKHEN